MFFKWNLLDSDTRGSRSVFEFKKKLLCKVGPTESCAFNIYDIDGDKNSIKALQFSALNEHKFMHRLNAISSICKCGIAHKEKKQFLLHCTLYSDIRLNLHDEISEILGLDTFKSDDDFLCSLLLYGNDQFPFIISKILLEVTIKYIKSLKRFKSFHEES